MHQVFDSDSIAKIYQAAQTLYCPSIKLRYSFMDVSGTSMKDAGWLVSLRHVKNIGKQNLIALLPAMRVA